MYGLKHYLLILVLVLLPLTAVAAGPHMLIEAARDWAPCVMAGAALALRVRFLKIHRRR